MACLQPKLAWWSDRPNPDTGNRVPVFSPKNATDLYPPFTLPCGKCPNCRQTKVNEKATQCSFEMATQEHNCFITLTYDDDHLPIYDPIKCPTGTLVKKHLQDFHKNLRQSLKAINGSTVTYKYLQSGEYGADENTARPHYHILIMGYDFHDKKLASTGASQKRPFYTSQLLDKLWTKGHYKLETASPSTASYVAKYAAKEKLNGEVNQESLETTGRIPQFVTQSQNIGVKRLLDNADELIKHGTFIIPGVTPLDASKGMTGTPLTNYHMKKLEQYVPEKVQPLKESRLAFAKSQSQPYQSGRPRIGGQSHLDTDKIQIDTMRTTYIRAKNQGNGSDPVIKALGKHLKKLEKAYQYRYQNPELCEG